MEGGRKEEREGGKEVTRRVLIGKDGGDGFAFIIRGEERRGRKIRKRTKMKGQV